MSPDHRLLIGCDHRITSEARERVCHRCPTQIWLSPATLLIENEPGTEIICVKCAGDLEDIEIIITDEVLAEVQKLLGFSISKDELKRIAANHLIEHTLQNSYLLAGSIHLRKKT